MHVCVCVHMCAHACPTCTCVHFCILSVSCVSHHVCLHLHLCAFVSNIISCTCLYFSRWTCLCMASWCQSVTLCLFVMSVCLSLCLSVLALVCISVCACDWLGLWICLNMGSMCVCPCHMSPFPFHVTPFFCGRRKTLHFQAAGQLSAWAVMVTGELSL